MQRTVQLEDPFGATEVFELQEETVAEAPPVPTPVRSTPAEAVLFSEDVDAWLSSAAEVKLTELEPYLKVALGWPSTQKKRLALFPTRRLTPRPPTKQVICWVNIHCS